MKEKTSVQSSRVKAVQAELELNGEGMANLLGSTAGVYYNKLAGNANWTLKDLVTLHDKSGHSFDYFFGLESH